jgi:hypothetical protein
LARLGDAWLGREAATDREVERPCIEGFASEALAEITAEPRRYGLHATLKAPFRLTSEWSEAALDATLAEFASTQQMLKASALRVAHIGGFLALTPRGPTPELDLLAQTCVERLDVARAPLEPEELARRRAAPLTSEQEAHLQLWGYPYVMRDYRFHVTLTGRIDPNVADRLAPLLRDLFAPVTVAPLDVQEIALYVEPEPRAPFRLLHRYALRGLTSKATRRRE